ncbi:BREX-6 system phosphatase PglZ [Lujinxingia vulgaris]|uniref:BREX-6 system phosphatase PglZ n=1 Tax=Lujinxingia vulgaris TaxID=2600176 RepID=A0A5C6X5A3_9DELT|nr:BREX-6 system phosphatase PglZ [Lujinxingia vulgaris]TXD36980.1 BREX-6 system phosphatase PglZ [Lujinxingia vulgaris]
MVEIGQDNWGQTSATLSHELTHELRRSGLLVWLDPHAHFTSFVDELAGAWAEGEFPFPVMAYRGSFLELMLALDGHLEGAENRALLIHMPGFNTDTIKTTPVFEHYEAGKCYQKNLTTLVREAAAGKVTPEAIEAFVAQGEFTLEKADAWLKSETSGGGADLGQFALSELWKRLRSGDAALPEPAEVEEHLRARQGIEVGWMNETGLSVMYRGDGEGSAAERYALLADWMTSWALAVEYVRDLKRPLIMGMLRPATELQGSLVEECREFASFLRKNEQSYYARIANEFEGLIGEEAHHAKPEDLGRIDTFRFEERIILEGALAALGETRWEDALTWARQRLEGGSFWIEQEPARRASWELVQAAGELGVLLKRHDDPLAGAMSVDEASARYADKVWEVDRAHRRMEQERSAKLHPSIPEFARVRGALDGVRELYQAWVGQGARRFNGICETYGFLPTESRQQRWFFEQDVAPLTRQPDSEVVALFLVDALRYEMAVDLMEHLTPLTSTKVRLDHRLAELPTITAVGMNALAPVQQSGGRLSPVISKQGRFQGFKTAHTPVRTPETRRKMMQHVVGGRTCPLFTLDEVLTHTNLTRAVAGAALVVVHSQGIDEAGEQGFGQMTFEQTLGQIRGAMQLLRQAKVKRFVVTADHGFLLLDGTTRRIPHGKTTDPNGARWRLYDHKETSDDIVSVPLKSLQYNDVEGFLLMPRDASIFDRGGSTPDFVHGGNSLQERMVPVLRVTHARDPGGSTATYHIEATKDESRADNVPGISVHVRPEQGTLDFGGPAEVALALEVSGAADAVLELHSVEEPGRLESGAVVVPVGQEVRVYFNLRLASGVKRRPDQRARITLHAPGLGGQFKAQEAKGWFVVPGVGVDMQPTEPGLASESTPIDDEATITGLEALPEGPRKIFAHLARFDAISEADATRLIGSPRALRKFVRELDAYCKVAGFKVMVEQTPAGKRFERR